MAFDRKPETYEAGIDKIFYTLTMHPVSDNNFNKKFFTEADSPVPLLPFDTAWSNMQHKLDAEEKKKRRFIFWWLFTGVLVGILLTGSVVVIWKYKNKETFPVKTGSSTTQFPEGKGSVEYNDLAINKSKHTTVTSTDTNHAAPIIEDAGYATIATLPLHNKEKNKKLPVRSKPILTANDEAVDYPEERNSIVRNKAAQGETDKILPFSFPERIRLTDSILVHANLQLPLRSLGPCIKDSVHIFRVEAGLQWKVPITSNNPDFYLKGPNGSDQLYRLLLPGVWIALNKNKHRLLATVNPFLTAPLPAKNITGDLGPDSLAPQAKKQMIKLFGFQAGVQYGYNLTAHWRVSGGVDANWWKKGLGAVRADSMNFLFTVNPKKEEALVDFQMSASVAACYQYKAAEGFLQVSIPFNKTVKSIPSPIWGTLGVRWRLLNLKQKQP